MSNRALPAAFALSFCLFASGTEAQAQVSRVPNLEPPAAVETRPANDAVVPPLRLSAEVRQAVLNLEQTPRLERPVAGRRVEPSSMVLGSLYVSTAVMQGLDVHSTLSGLRSGAVEANPMMQQLVNRPAVFIATKAAIGAGTIMAARTVAKKNKVAAVIALAVLNTAYGAIVHHNYQIARGMR